MPALLRPVPFYGNKLQAPKAPVLPNYQLAGRRAVIGLLINLLQKRAPASSAGRDGGLAQPGADLLARRRAQLHEAQASRAFCRVDPRQPAGGLDRAVQVGRQV